MHFFATRLLPIVLCAGGALYFGNVAYMSLSMAFIQILKVSDPFTFQQAKQGLQFASTLHIPCAYN